MIIFQYLVVLAGRQRETLRKHHGHHRCSNIALAVQYGVNDWQGIRTSVQVTERFIHICFNINYHVNL
jgi:hypothetical protein